MLKLPCVVHTLYDTSVYSNGVHLFLSATEAGDFLSTSRTPRSLRFVLVLLHHLILGLPVVLFLLDFGTHFSHACYLICSSDSPWVADTVICRVQTLFCSSALSFYSLSSKYSVQHSGLKQHLFRSGACLSWLMSVIVLLSSSAQMPRHHLKLAYICST